MTLDLRIAAKADAQAIADLVNRAYRPAPHAAGWTHESHLVAGERTSAGQVRALFQPRSVILLLCSEANIVACVHLQGDSSGASIGMLATDPGLQAQGLGKRMLFQSERSEQLGASLFRISVLSSRPELLAFYQRRGYVLTGEVEDYPLSAGVGRPMVAGIQVLSLMKTP